MSTLAELWSSITDRAMVIDSLMDRIAFTLDLHDPRDSSGSGLNGGKVSGGESLSPQDRATLDPRPDTEAIGIRLRPNPSDVAARRIEGDQKRFVDAVGEIMVRAHSRGAPGNWDDAVKDAHLIDELGLVDGLIAGWGQGPARRWVLAAGDALDDIDTALRQYVRRLPSNYEVAHTSGLADEDCCRICLQVEPRGHYRVERKSRRSGLCEICYRLKLVAGKEPPVELIAVWHDCDCRGQSVAWRNARARWLETMGVSVAG